MRRHPATLALAALVAAGLAPAVSAAPAKICHLIVDNANDSRYDVQAHDLVGGDIATGRTQLVAVIRLKSLADDPKATVYGATYRFSFTVAKARYLLELRRALGSADNARLMQGSQMVAAPEVKIDTQGHLIRFTLARTVFPDLKKAGIKITELNLDTGTGTAAVINTDDAKPKIGTAYADKAPSCLAPQ